MKLLNLFLLTIVLVGASAEAQRLPDVAVPDNYRLTFTPDFDKDNFSGDETIQIRVLKVLGIAKSIRVASIASPSSEREAA